MHFSIARKKPSRPGKRRTLTEKTAKELITVLDKPFSEYIRLKHSDENGYCRCITCGQFHFWNGGSIHNGHYINRDVKVTRFDERNCRPQCLSCNSYHSGKIYLYRQRLVEIYGEDEIKKLEMIANLGGGYTAWDLQQMIVEYRKKVKALKLEKGL